MATFTVTNLNDSGPGSFRDAVAQANAVPILDPNPTVNFGINGTITLTSGTIIITRSMTIENTTADTVIVFRDNTAADFRILEVSPNLTVTITGLVITNGASTLGAGILVGQGTNYTLNNMTFSQNNITSPPSTGGAGLFAAVNTVGNISNSIFINNTAPVSGGIFPVNANGGGILNLGVLTITYSTFDTNTANFGGAIFTPGQIDIRYSTIRNNRTFQNGGGIYFPDTFGQDNNIYYNSIYDNIADGSGGDGIDVATGAGNTVTISNNTFTQIIAPYSNNIAIYNFNGNVTLINNTIHNPINTETVSNPFNPDPGAVQPIMSIGNTILDVIFDAFTNLGNNFITSISGDPGLGPLLDNGGPTLTMLPNDGSPLIDAGNNALSDSPTDQRGFFRIVDGAIDIGSVEANSTPVCYSGESLVLAKNIKTGAISEICACDISSEVHMVYDIESKTFVPVKYNIVTGPVTRFMKIAKDTFAFNEPSEDFFVTGGHKLVIGNQTVKARNLPQAKRVKVKSQMVYSICTENKSILKINGLKVLAWGLQEWTDYSIKNNINWINNKPLKNKTLRNFNH